MILPDALKPGANIENILTINNYWITLIDMFILAEKFDLPLIIFGRWDSKIPSVGVDSIAFNEIESNETKVSRPYSYLLKIENTKKTKPRFGIMKYKNRLKIRNNEFPPEALERLLRNKSIRIIDEYIFAFLQMQKKGKIKGKKMGKKLLTKKKLASSKK